MKKNIFKIGFAFLMLLVVVSPVLVFAQAGVPGTVPTGIVGSRPIQACADITDFGKLICETKQILDSIIPLLVALGLVYFVWGVVTYFIGDTEEAKSAGRDRIIYGIIGFAIIAGLWGFVTIIVRTFDLGGAVSSVQISNLVVPGSSTSCGAINSTSNFQNVVNYITCVIGQSIIPLIFAIAIVTFIWGAMKFFIFESDEEAKREQGKQFMLWGIVALAVMLSVWGLVSILTTTFGVSGTVLPTIQPPVRR